MRIVQPSEFAGTAAELQVKVDAYAAALEAHKATEGVPAPWPELPCLPDIIKAGGFVLASPPDAPTAPRALTPREFRERFTADEQAAINAAAMTDAAVFDWRIRAAEARAIELDHAETVAGLAFLVGKGLIDAARPAEILA